MYGKPKPKPKPKPRPKIGRILAAAVAVVAVYAATLQAAPGEKTDTSAVGHYDTVLSAGSFGDTVHFGFLANEACVCVPSISAASVLWYGRGVELQSRGSGTMNNRRAGKSSFVSQAYTPPASTCYNYKGDAPLRGVYIGGTWTGDVLIIADSVNR